MQELEFELEPQEIEWFRNQLEIWGGIDGQHQFAYYESDGSTVRLFPIE